MNGAFNYLLMLVVAIVVLIWYIRPLYNFMAKRKYLLLDMEKMSLIRKIQTALPSIIFYLVIFGLMFYPAVTNKLLGVTQAGSIFIVQVLLIFLLSRYDKWQTQYKVENDGIRFKKKFIHWQEPYSVIFKKSVFIILHKPRFIILSKETKIVVPLLSSNIQQFIMFIEKTNESVGSQIKRLYQNTKDYYVLNIDIAKEINKIAKESH